MKRYTLKNVKSKFNVKVKWYINLYWDLRINVNRILHFLCYEVKNYFFRMRDGIGPEDVYDLDVYIAKIIISGLEIYQRDKCNTLKCLYGKRAKYIIHTMLKGYKSYVKEFKGAKCFKGKETQIYKKAQVLFKKYHKDLWI